MTQTPMSSIWLDRAIDKLWPFVNLWVHYPQSEGKEAKQRLFETYEALDPRERAAYDEDVRRAFVAAHGSDRVTAYRRRKAERETLGGLSLSTEEPTWMHPGMVASHEVFVGDVLVHWAQSAMPLSGKAFGHEKEIILKPTADAVYKPNPVVDQAVVEYVREHGLKPSMKADEARNLIRVYLRLLGMQQDAWGNFKRDGERVHFGAQRVKIQRKEGSRWETTQSSLPSQWARTIVVKAAKAAGDTAMESRFRGGVETAKKAKARAVQAGSEKKSQEVVDRLAQKHFAMQQPDVLVQLGASRSAPSQETKDRLSQLGMGWRRRLETNPPPQDDAMFASVDHPPVLPVFFNHKYTWTEQVDDQPYSIHVASSGKDSASVTIGAYGNVTVDPMTKRMKMPTEYAPVGDAQATGQILWDSEQKAFVGLLFLLMSLKKQSGAGARVLQLWCRMMRGYSIEVWIAQAVGSEGQAFIEAMAKKGKVRVVGKDRSDLLVACDNLPDPIALNDPLWASWSSESWQGQAADPPKKASGPTSYLVELMQWDGLVQVLDRKDRVKTMDQAINIATDFVRQVPSPKLAKVFVSAMRGKAKLSDALILENRQGSSWGWGIVSAKGISEQQADALQSALRSARAMGLGSRPHASETRMLPEGFEGFDYSDTKDNPTTEGAPGRAKLTVRATKAGYRVSGHDKFGSPVHVDVKTKQAAQAVRAAFHRIIADRPELVSKEIESIASKDGSWPWPRNDDHPSEFDYHVTFYNRLGTICERGILPVAGMASSSMGKGGYAGHSQGKAFLTEHSGVDYWYDRAEQVALDSADDWLAEGFTPVVLRVPRVEEKKVDASGSEDAGHDAWYVTREIDPEGIELWSGSKWIPVQDWQQVDPSQAYDESGQYILPDHSNPLIPR